MLYCPDKEKYSMDYKCIFYCLVAGSEPRKRHKLQTSQLLRWTRPVSLRCFFSHGKMLVERFEVGAHDVAKKNDTQPALRVSL